LPGALSRPNTSPSRIRARRSPELDLCTSSEAAAAALPAPFKGRRAPISMTPRERTATMMVTPRVITASLPVTAREPKSGRRASVPVLQSQSHAAYLSHRHKLQSQDAHAA
jgi:hypothetical protein